MRDTNFQVGDYVRFRTVEDMIEEFGSRVDSSPKVKCGFNSNMKCLVGETGRIIYKDGYIVRLDNPAFNSWFISVDMIEHTEEIPTVTLSELLNDSQESIREKLQV